jgi:hypothetical protein
LNATCSRDDIIYIVKKIINIHSQEAWVFKYLHIDFFPAPIFIKLWLQTKKSSVKLMTTIYQL